MTYTLDINGVPYTTKELFEYVNGFKAFGVRMQRSKPNRGLTILYEGIQIVKYKDHDRAGGNYYYRIKYSNNINGVWHKTTLARLIPIIEKLSRRRGWYLSY